MIASHNLTHRASTTQLFEGEEAGELADKKHLKKESEINVIYIYIYIYIIYTYIYMYHQI